MYNRNVNAGINMIIKGLHQHYQELGQTMPTKSEQIKSRLDVGNEESISFIVCSGVYYDVLKLLVHMVEKITRVIS